MRNNLTVAQRRKRNINLVLDAAGLPKVDRDELGRWYGLVYILVQFQKRLNKFLSLRRNNGGLDDGVDNQKTALLQG